jgi:apolipoprotein N-acyltransferase
MISALLSSIQGEETRKITVAAMDAGMTPGGFHHAPPELETERQALASLQGRYWDLAIDASSKGAELYVWSEKFFPLDPLQDAGYKARLEAEVDSLNMAMAIAYRSQDNRNIAIPVFPGSGFATPYEKIRIASVVGEKAEAGKSRPIYAFSGANFGLLICYDMHYEENTRILTRLGAEAILVASNAASWRNSKGWVLRTASLRAAENRIGFAVATDVGSFIIAPSGRVLARTEGTPGYSLHEIPLSRGGTVYTRWGHWGRFAFPFCFLGVLGYAGLPSFLARKRAP